MTQIIKFISYTIMYSRALVEQKYFVLTTVTLTFLDQTKALTSFILMTLRKIFAVDTQFKQLRKRSPKKIQASAGFEPVTSAIPVQCSTN